MARARKKKQAVASGIMGPTDEQFGRAGYERAAKWLIAEYYDSLKHLSEAGFDALTRRLKETCIFFPTIRECLDATTPSGPYDWGHPFLKKPNLFRVKAPDQPRQIEDGRAFRGGQ